MFIKICGITNIEDALVATKAGASALGFVFAPSPRQVTFEQAKAIIRQLPQNIQKVGVFVDENIDKINHIAKEVGLTMIQLHGKEKYQDYKKIPLPIIKAIRISKNTDLSILDKHKNAKYLLLDTFVEGLAGGTGKTFDWNLALEARAYTILPIILSGGLTPENVQTAIQIARPDGVDASSGLELAPGKKDHKKIIEFIQKVNS